VYDTPLEGSCVSPALKNVGAKLEIVVEKLKLLPLLKGVVAMPGPVVNVPHVPETVRLIDPACAEDTASIPIARTATVRMHAIAAVSSKEPSFIEILLVWGSIYAP
jgi:hypothetical protein